MQNHRYQNATIVQLSPAASNETVEVSTFEEAFEGYSNLKGRGRARRAKRKSERQANRQKKRMTRINNRQERKSTRKSNRQANRQQKAEAKALRKSTKLDARLDRKAKRKASRGGDETEPDSDELQTDSASTQDNTGTSDDAQYQQSAPQYSQESSGEESGYEAEQESYEEDPGGGSEEETGEESFSEEESEPDYGFAGEEAGSSFNSEINDDDCPTIVQISVPVMDTARKIVWNEQLVHNLKNKIGQGGNDTEIYAHIENRQNRIEQLESMLGDYSEARGGGKSKRQEVRAAKKEARKELRAVKQEKRAEKKATRHEKRKTVPVDKELSPEISHDQINIPAEEVNEFAGGTGTGITNVDQPGTQNVAHTRVVELTSSAEGPFKSVDWKTAGITAGIVVVILGGLKLAKVI